MKIGTRILYPEEVDMWDADILQISLYHGMKDNLKFMMNCVNACRQAGMPYVIHPVGYSLLNDEMFEDLRKMAELTDLAFLLHDERTPDGKRLTGTDATRFRESVEELRAITSVSFENSENTRDVQWFWSNFRGPITIDIGHIESSGLDSIEFIQSLGSDVISNIEFVHMHRNNGLRGGITDHWPLTDDCREVKALEELLKLKPDVNVFLELNEVDETDRSLTILRELKEKLSRFS